MKHQSENQTLKTAVKAFLNLIKNDNQNIQPAHSLNHQQALPLNTSVQQTCLASNPCLDSNSESQPQNLELEQEQLEKTFSTLKKLKFIAKSKKLTQLKAKNKEVNRLFKNMSYFFMWKSQLSQHRKKKLKQAQIKAQSSVGIRNKVVKTAALPQSVKEYSLLLKEMKIELSFHKCYICKNKFSKIHHFYDCLCLDCAEFNFLKRNQTANLNEFTALVTGGRIKIGFQIVLKLLRDGAKVIATTRFWKDAMIRYKKQVDYQVWKSRLFLFQCDFTSSSQVSKLIQTIKKKFNRLDILINNAAQTIVRPKQFYLQQIVNEAKNIDYLSQHLKQLEPTATKSIIQRYPSLFITEKPQNILPFDHLAVNPQEKITSVSSLHVNTEIDHKVRDEFDQPLDKRLKNSWVQQLNEVSLIDCYTTQLVNSIVPFHLIGELKPLMIKRKDENPSFIINVSSMEGVFYRLNKQSTHPHTNMAKAALNMITRTSAQEFANHQIYMNSVDTGWVTEQNPYQYVQKRRIPLDCVDGAMRVLDPIYTGVREKIYQHGHFLKDYMLSNW